MRAVRHLAVMGAAIERRDQLAPRETAGGAEYDEFARIGRNNFSDHHIELRMSVACIGRAGRFEKDRRARSHRPPIRARSRLKSTTIYRT